MLARRRVPRLPLVGAGVGLLLLLSTTVSTAQLPIIPTPTPAPTAEPDPDPTLTPPPPTEEPPSPVPSGILPPEDEVVPTPKGKATPKPTAGGDPIEDVLDDLPEGLEEELDVPSFARTRPRNTVKLVKILSELADLGVPLEQALVEGMGRFPVAGLANYFDDWLNPRYTPKPHLHHGLDIFADFGTPIRSPDSGVVSQLSEHGAGGIAVWVRAQDGTSYYFAHMLERVDGIRTGMKVDVGTVLGFVGDTGNASGGTPHLHFEIHPGAGEAVPPKPTVDAWLDEAEELAPRFVAARRSEIEAKGNVIGSSIENVRQNEEIEASMLLTLLDPVGGSVGLLPTLELRPRQSGLVSDRLLSELIRQRVGGHVLLPKSAHFAD